MEDTRELPPLRTFIDALDRNLSAREMHVAVQEAGYETPLSSVHTARTSLRIAKPRKPERRVASPAKALPPITAFPLPSDETILANLIVKLGLDRARAVFERVERTFERFEL